MKSIIHLNIKKIREMKNLTREYVADELDMSTSGYAKIERGEVDLTITRLNNIALVLNVSVDFIFKFDVSTFFEE
jgi:transcriptional regulator with XRE-family HTH domain